jgi:hypothetical protein
MRKLFLILSAVAAVGFTVPLSTSAEAAKVVIKSGDRGHHYGRGHRKVVVIKRGHHDNGLHRGWRNHHRARVVVR